MCFLNAKQSGNEVMVISDNEELRRRLSEKALPRPLTMQVPVEGNYFAQVVPFKYFMWFLFLATRKVVIIMLSLQLLLI